MSLSRSAKVSLLLAAALSASLTAVAAQQCRVSYKSSPRRPLLFGGVVESCTGFRCQNRNDYYARKCGAADGATWGTCTSGQASEIINYAQRVMPDGIDMSPCDLMSYLQGRTLWIMGDSHTKTLWTALQCFLIDFWDHNICAASVDQNAVNELANLPKVKGYSNCMHLLGAAGGRICIIEVILGTYLSGNAALPAGGVLPLLRQKFAQPQDIFYINFGAWHRKNSADWATFIPALETLGRDYQQNKGTWPHVLFRENSAIHSKNLEKKVCEAAPGYDYQTGSGRLTATAVADADEQKRFEIGRPLSEIVNSVLPKYGVPVVQSFNYTVPLAKQHIEMNHVSELDCIHYCYPGVPQMWIWDLFKAMKSGAAGIKPLKVVSRAPGFNFGGNRDDEGSAPAPASAPTFANAGQQTQGGGRLFEALRFPFGHRRLQGATGVQRVLQAQRYPCARSSVTF